MKRMTRIFLMGLISTLWAMVMVGCNSAKQVDLMDFAMVDFTGIDGHGSGSLFVSWSDFEKEVLTEEEMDSIISLAKLASLEDSIKYSIDKKENLSNGDIVTLSVEWDDSIAKEYNLKFTGKSQEIVAAGLMEAIELDLFAEVYVEYSGVSPNAAATVRNASDNAFLKTVKYSLDNQSSLANGDTLTVTASYNESEAMDKGYIVLDNEKTYIVEGIDEYISSYEQIDADTLSDMEQQARDIIDSALANSSYTSYLYPGNFIFLSKDSVSINSIELKNGYFFTLKKGMDKMYGDVYNSLFLVYEVNFTTNRTEEGEVDVVYLPVYFKDIVLRDTGVLDVKITDASITSAKNNNFDNLYRDIVTANKAKYEFVEIEY